ncbi:MAG: T9SS type A sorting domain-containing protein, partial [Bacteroidota bacterium]|nr:T9SS type A sorting domain-containing protein [Bacteroidota bacterium]
TVSVQEIEIYTVPSPPIICLGDSIVMEIDPALNDIVWTTGDTLDRVGIYPTSSSTYVVEAFDLVGCERRGEILVEVDTCSVQGMEDLLYEDIVIYPNPTTSDLYIDLPTNAIFSLRIFNLIGEEVYSNTDIKKHFSFNSTAFPRGYYTIKLRHKEMILNRKIIFQ